MTYWAVATVDAGSGDPEYSIPRTDQGGSITVRIPLGTRPDPSDDGVAQEGQSEDRTNFQTTESRGREVQHQHDREEPVGEHANRAGRKEDPAIPVE